MLFVLNETSQIGNMMLMELRDQFLQKDRSRFRNNMERLGSIMAYEISKKLEYVQKDISTPLGKTKIQLLKSQPVLITVLRAGIPYFQGFLNFFNQADTGFVGAFRKEGESELEISLNYLALPSLAGRDIILIDPMLATGKSFVKVINALHTYGIPKHIHIAAVVAAPEGIAYLKEQVQSPYSIWTCSLDDRLNELFYIVPGLGDAGDLSFGEKI